MDTTQLLSSVEFFAEFEPAELAQVAAAGAMLDLVRGDWLFREQDVADTAYVVVSGRIAISSHSVDGRESVFSLMEESDFFGEMGLFDGGGRSADARALEASQVLVVPYGLLREVVERRPTLLWGVVRTLSRRLRLMDEALADAVFLDVTGRTAKRLLELAGDRDHFEMPITQEELAGLVGASRERVNKALAAFGRLHWIEQSERTYTIVDRRQLEIRAR